LRAFGATESAICSQLTDTAGVPERSPAVEAARYAPIFSAPSPTHQPIGVRDSA